MARRKPTTRRGAPTNRRKTALARKKVKTQTEVWKARKAIETGRILSIDPSCHSVRPGHEEEDLAAGKSQPGWAIAEAGKIVESGVIALTPDVGRRLQDRLHEIARIVREELAPLGPFDAILIEDIPLKRYGGPGARSSMRAQMSLHYSVAVFYASLKTKSWVKLPPVVWHHYVDDLVGELAHTKSDEGDAIAFVAAALLMLAEGKAERAASMSGARKTIRLRRPKADPMEGEG